MPTLLLKLVVVVVVYAMATSQPKREKAGSVETVLKRDENSSNENNVYHRINLSDVPVERGQSVILDVFKLSGQENEKIATYEARTYGTEDGVTLLKEIIEENNLKPGQRIKVDVYDNNIAQSTIESASAEIENRDEILNQLKSIEGQIKSLKEKLENDEM